MEMSRERAEYQVLLKTYTHTNNKNTKTVGARLTLYLMLCRNNVKSFSHGIMRVGKLCLLPLKWGTLILSLLV